ncbi:MAG TPA: bifunctional alpha,alpha-trehalose-phosphate synthase (UDP-forming)/trehalose-phosphatase [Polyangiales bacterium]|nr:bifunctional alpha,alpha-trehalose-phosphate synthase (UDP-forming)/trehalose-phosphatase [Polyangiales bacterium]
MILVSNRLPVTVGGGSEAPALTPSSGGLASALRDYHEANDVRWIGWLGDTSALSDDAVAELSAQAARKRLKPVMLSAREVSLFYDGYANAVLWPLFHYLLDKVQLDASDEWRAYAEVNERFAGAIASELKASDSVWVHDYQLMLVPALLRQRAISARVGFFLHIPWPSADVFRILPSRAEILAGLLGADLIGFQTDDARQNFLHSAAEVLGVDYEQSTIHWEDREVHVGVYPISIDVPAFTRESREIEENTAKIRGETRGKKIVLGVDRLDYTKGLDRRMLAVDRLLERQPGLRDQLHYIQIAVPSREKIDAYAELRKTVNELVTRINSSYGSPTSSPVQFLYRSISHAELLALYRAADVMLVTPLRDGMNLVAKEYVAARVDGRGCLVLSEFAGAAEELATAITVNPNDVDGLAGAIERALFMSEEEQQLRMRELRQVVTARPVQAWAAEFLQDLSAIQPAPPALVSAAAEIEQASQQLVAAKHRTLLLDYDGTLVPIEEWPGLAAPSQQLLQLLARLADGPTTAVHVVTGRAQDSIEAWLGKLPIWLHVEHGLRSRRPDGAWLPAIRERPAMLDASQQIMKRYAAQTRGAFVETKAGSASFHYRRCNPLAAARSLHDLRAELQKELGRNTQLLDGHKVLEARLPDVSKKLVVQRALAEAPPDTLVMAAGDDRTDEDMFAALPGNALTIHVGAGASAAKLRVEAPRTLLGMLARLV